MNKNRAARLTGLLQWAVDENLFQATDQRRAHGYKAVHAPRPGAGGDAERRRVRGVSEDGRRVGAPAPVPQLRARRLLRQLEEQARDEALPLFGPSHRPVLRAGRGLELVLR